MERFMNSPKIKFYGPNSAKGSNKTTAIQLKLTTFCRDVRYNQIREISDITNIRLELLHCIKFKQNQIELNAFVKLVMPLPLR